MNTKTILGVAAAIMAGVGLWLITDPSNSKAAPAYCNKLFTPDQAARAADRTFAGTKDVTHAEWHRLFHYENCQRVARDRFWVKSDRQMERRLWAHRRWVKAHLQYGVASYYNDAGATACGFHAQYGVAHKTLPCGTHVTFYYGGRTIHAIVEDRGPYIAGRDWDFNQNIAAAIPEIYGPGSLTVGYTIP